MKNIFARYFSLIFAFLLLPNLTLAVPLYSFGHVRIGNTSRLAFDLTILNRFFRSPRQSKNSKQFSLCRVVVPFLNSSINSNLSHKLLISSVRIKKTHRRFYQNYSLFVIHYSFGEFACKLTDKLQFIKNKPTSAGLFQIILFITTSFWLQEVSHHRESSFLF